MPTEDQTVSVLKLSLALLLGGLALKYFFFPSNTTTQTPTNNRAREADIETVQQMFPQIPRRSIMWDLQRNGGSVPATTERILSGRGLDNPPQTFQPPLPPSSPSTINVAPASTTQKTSQPDLITRYNLADKITNADDTEETTTTTTSGKQAWSQNKGERSALLQKRREEMILAARKKMEAKVKAEAAQKSTGVDIS